MGTLKRELACVIDRRVVAGVAFLSERPFPPSMFLKTNNPDCEILLKIDHLRHLTRRRNGYHRFANLHAFSLSRDRAPSQDLVRLQQPL
jgi:hypothetical protein